MLEPFPEPVPLWSIQFVERTVQKQQQRTARLNCVISILFEIREASEIVGQRHVEIPMKIMVSQRGEDGDLARSPDGRLAVVDIPVGGFVAVVGYVATEDDELRMGRGDRRHQLLSKLGVRRLSVSRVGKPRVTVHYKAKMAAYLCANLQRRRLRVSGTPGKGDDQNGEQLARER